MSIFQYANMPILSAFSDFISTLSYSSNLQIVLWAVMDSNHRRRRQQIYSLPHLATLVTALTFIINTNKPH